MKQNNDFPSPSSKQKSNKGVSNQINYVNLLKNMRLEQDLKRIRHFKELQKNMKKDKQEISEIQQQLEKVQRQIKQKKQQLIQKQLQKLEQKRKQREKFILQSNKALSQVKTKMELRKKNIQLVVKQTQQKQVDKYHKAIQQRVNRYRNPINFQDIKQHEHKYLNMKTSMQKQKQVFNEKISKKLSLRVKSQIGSHYQNQFENLSIDHKSILDQRIKDQFKEAKQKERRKRSQIIKLIQKRKQYGNKAEKQLKNVRVKTQPSDQSKRQRQSRVFWQKINQQKQSIINAKKPKLNTNLPRIHFQNLTKLQVKRITEDKNIDTLDKIQKLRRIQDCYLQKLKLNNPQAVDILSQLTLIKADLYLKY